MGEEELGDGAGMPRQQLSVRPTVHSMLNLLDDLPGGKIPVPERRPGTDASEETGVSWRYTLEEPSQGWHLPSYDDSSWRQGPGGFGTEKTPGTSVRTVWNGDHIWLRREFELDATPSVNPQLRIRHDEDAEVYLNGRLAAKLSGYNTSYALAPIRREARECLKPGKNLVAVHCRQTIGG